MFKEIENNISQLRLNSKSDCENCCAYAVSSLPLGTDGFPWDKEAGSPCANCSRIPLQVHQDLSAAAVKGWPLSTALGPGKGSQTTFQGIDGGKTDDG